jgi:tyrosyl-tRNA synthetase
VIKSALEGVPAYKISIDKFNEGINILDLLAVDTDILPSKAEAKKMIAGGGIAINKGKINDIAKLISSNDLLQGSILFVQKGKKNYYLIEVI